MSAHVFVVSEWLAKKGREQELWLRFKELMSATKKEPGCISARATRQIIHPNAPGNSKYTIVLMQEYINLQAFEAHCTSDHVVKFVKAHMANEATNIIEDWRCRLFSEEA